MANDLLLAQALRSAREAAGLTVEQVSARTRIRSGLLRELEAGQTASCGAAVYARGHLKAIASATGTDPAPLLAAYAGQPSPVADGALPDDRSGRGQDRPERAGRTAGPSPRRLVLPEAAAPERRGPRWGAAVGAAVGLLAVLAVIGSVQDQRSPVPDVLGGTRPAAAAAPARVAEQPARAAAPAARPAPRPARPAAPALRVRVTEQSSWVAVRAAGGGLLYEGVLPAGTSRDFAGSGLRLTVGNAASVTLACAGGKGVAAGAAGQVRRWTCGPRGAAPA